MLAQISTISIPSDLISCFKEVMKIDIRHFQNKYSSFDTTFLLTANTYMIGMLSVARGIQMGLYAEKDLNKYFYESGGNEQNEFLQAIFDCFKCMTLYKGIELQKELYSHTNRGGDSWFPIVVIDQVLGNYSCLPSELEVYRGCSKDEYRSKKFRQRQSWTQDKDTARCFAFTHYSRLDPAARVILKATIKSSDVAWIRSGESEIVLLPGFNPSKIEIVETYQQYCNRNP